MLLSSLNSFELLPIQTTAQYSHRNHTWVCTLYGTKWWNAEIVGSQLYPCSLDGSRYAHLKSMINGLWDNGLTFQLDIHKANWTFHFVSLWSFLHFSVSCNCAQFVLELRPVKICKQLFKNCFETLLRFHCWINQKEDGMKGGLFQKLEINIENLHSNILVQTFFYQSTCSNFWLQISQESIYR